MTLEDWIDYLGGWTWSDILAYGQRSLTYIYFLYIYSIVVVSESNVSVNINELT